MLPQPSPVDATAVLGRRFVAFLVDAILATLIGGVVFFAVSDVLEGTARFGFTCADVRDAGGTILHSGTNRAGSSRVVQGTPPFRLVVGNSANVVLEQDGKTVDLAVHTRGSVARLTLP